MSSSMMCCETLYFGSLIVYNRQIFHWKLLICVHADMICCTSEGRSCNSFGVSSYLSAEMLIPFCKGLRNSLLKQLAGNSVGIKIHAVFVSKASGRILSKYAGIADVELWIIPSFENSAWSIMAISFISLLAMSAVLATCFFVRRHRIRREQPRASHVREFHGMSSRLVKAMPSLIFTAVLEDNCTSRTCAICLEDYSVGEKLRILPCRHKFHADCVDAWLTSWRTFCPVCKRDARTNTGDLPASERTPLLSSTPSSVSTSMLSSVRSSSSAIQIVPASSRSPSLSHSHSISSTPCNSQSLQSYHQSPYLSVGQSSIDLRNTSSQRSHASYLVSSQSICYPSLSHLNSRYMSPYNRSMVNVSTSYIQQPHPMHCSRSFVDLRNASSQRSQASHVVSFQSVGYPSLSPLNSRYMSPYNRSAGNASPSYIGSSGQQPNPLHYSESAASFSPFASAQSLPGC
ncbi:unnamed protein product [Ilex paraguariensis]|uniref:RING-type domain-containing protein n=1 Tax=Ilex paraguariensis TaxID=185542 RepID=A0ABC8QWL7_9AQUA